MIKMKILSVGIRSIAYILTELDQNLIKKTLENG